MDKLNIGVSRIPSEKTQFRLKIVHLVVCDDQNKSIFSNVLSPFSCPVTISNATNLMIKVKERKESE